LDVVSESEELLHFWEVRQDFIVAHVATEVLFNDRDTIVFLDQLVDGFACVFRDKPLTVVLLSVERFLDVTRFEFEMILIVDKDSSKLFDGDMQFSLEFDLECETA